MMMDSEAIRTSMSVCKKNAEDRGSWRRKKMEDEKKNRRAYEIYTNLMDAHTTPHAIWWSCRSCDGAKLRTTMMDPKRFAKWPPVERMHAIHHTHTHTEYCSLRPMPTCIRIQSHHPPRADSAGSKFKGHFRPWAARSWGHGTWQCVHPAGNNVHPAQNRTIWQSQMTIWLATMWRRCMWPF